MQLEFQPQALHPEEWLSSVVLRLQCHCDLLLFDAMGQTLVMVRGVCPTAEEPYDSDKTQALMPMGQVCGAMNGIGASL